MSDCEWMFGDAATGAWGFQEMSHLNPLRWSGAIDFDQGIKQMQEVLKATGSRPVLVKVPAGVSTIHKRFEKIEEAIAYLQKNDPIFLALKQDGEKKAREALKAESTKKDEADIAVAAAREEVAGKEEIVKHAKADLETANEAATSAKTHADTVQSQLDCAWMFGDAGKGLMGFGVAKLNPLRWSSRISLREGIEELKSVQADSPDRQIVVKVPGGTGGTEHRFQKGAAEAIAYLEGRCPLRAKANDACEKAKGEQTSATAKLAAAEADAAGARTRLQSASDLLTVAELNLESAKKIADQAKAELDEVSSAS